MYIRDRSDRVADREVRHEVLGPGPDFALAGADPCTAEFRACDRQPFAAARASITRSACL